MTGSIMSPISNGNGTVPRPTTPIVAHFSVVIEVVDDRRESKRGDEDGLIVEVQDQPPDDGGHDARDDRGQHHGRDEREAQVDHEHPHRVDADAPEAHDPEIDDPRQAELDVEQRRQGGQDDHPGHDHVQVGHLRQPRIASDRLVTLRTRMNRNSSTTWA